MDIMDPFMLEILSVPPPPATFSCGGAEQTDLAELGAYLRAIGVFGPALPPAVPDVASKISAASPELGDYDADIDFNLREMEKDAKERPSPDYLKTVQGNRMSLSKRGNLVVWMDAFIRHYDLAPGTLHRAVAYVDRVLSVRTLTTHDGYELCLLGAAAVFTAAKYEDQSTRRKLNAVEIARYCGFATSEEVVAMERNMVAALEYQLHGPTAYTFVDQFTRYSCKGEQDLKVQRLAHQLADKSLLDYGCLELMPSAVAASAIFLARLTLNPTTGQVQRWNKDLKELTGYRPIDLIAGIASMGVLNPDPRFLNFPREFLLDP